MICFKYAPSLIVKCIAVSKIIYCNTVFEILHRHFVWKCVNIFSTVHGWVGAWSGVPPCLEQIVMGYYWPNLTLAIHILSFTWTSWGETRNRVEGLNLLESWDEKFLLRRSFLIQPYPLPSDICIAPPENICTGYLHSFMVIPSQDSQIKTSKNYVFNCKAFSML